MRIKRFRHKYNKLSTRLIATITIAVVVCFSVFTFNVSSSLATAEFQRFEQNTELLSNYIDSEMSSLFYQISEINNYYELSLNNSETISNERASILKGLTLFNQYTDSVFLLKSPEKSTIIEYYKIADDGDLEVLKPNFNIKKILKAYEKQSDGRFFFFDKRSQRMFTIKSFVQESTGANILLGVELNTTFLTTYLEGSSQTRIGNIGIVNEDGTIVAHTSSKLIGTTLLDAAEETDFTTSLKSAIKNSERLQHTLPQNIMDYNLVDTNDSTFVYLPIYIEEYNAQWGVIVDVSNNALKESSLAVAKTILLGGLLTLSILMLIIKISVHIALKPIDSIMSVMKDIEDGNLESRTKIASCNEMEVIGNQLNNLLDHMIEDRSSIVKQKNEIQELLIEVENLMQENDRIYYETIKSLAKTIDAKDQYTGGHCERVTEFSMFIGQEMNLPQDELASLTYGAMLHDIGKIGIPESIITKQGQLTDEEYETIKTHPEKGFEILKEIHFLKDASLGVLQHHERYDGSGYPLGLASEAIDQKARIIAIADAFDAMTTDRSYRKALSTERAIEELIKNKGLQFDAKMVDIFIKGIQSSKLKL